MLALCKTLYPKYNIAALTNDIFTQEVYDREEGTYSRIENFLSDIMHYRMNVFGPWRQVIEDNS
jgi:hypothetical protein